MVPSTSNLQLAPCSPGPPRPIETRTLTSPLPRSPTQECNTQAEATRTPKSIKRTRLGNKGQYQGIRDVTVAQALRGTGGTRGQGALPRVRACPGVNSHCRHDLRSSSAIRAPQGKGVQGALPRGTRAPRCLHTLQARLGGIPAQSALHRGKAGTGQPSESRCRREGGGAQRITLPASQGVWVCAQRITLPAYRK